MTSQQSQGLQSILAVALLAIAALFIWKWESWEPVPEFETVRARHRPSDAWILDRNSIPLESIRTRSDQRSLEWLTLEEVSPIFQTLLIATEDQRFQKHRGVDPLALASAAWDSLRGGGRRGASTLTMQTASLINPNLMRAKSSGWKRKWLQILTALKMEPSWSKDQILEAYLNLVSFRGELVGLKAAALGFFQKSPRALSDAESALLIALLRSPNSKPAKIAERACRILHWGSQECAALQVQAENVFGKPYQLSRAREKVPVISQKFIESGWGTSLIHTSLDHQIQEWAQQAVREQLKELKGQNVKDAAVLVVETETGRVAAYVGNGGMELSSAFQIDGVQTKRQAASTIKPFVYATAFEMNYLDTSSLIEDSPADLPVGLGKVYHPQNYDNTFRGPVSAAEALASSLNVPAVRTLQLVREEAVVDRLRQLGFENLQDEDFYGPSLALGTVDVSLWNLTQGYRQLALQAREAEAVFSKETKKKIFKALTISEYRRHTFGLDSVLSLPFLAAVKTGTSKDMRDNWCVGWTSRYTVGVWVGNFDGQPMWNVSGVTGAAPIWRKLMLALHSTPPDPGFEVDYEKPAEVLKTRVLSKIRYPVDDMTVGLDPDIPSQLQKIPIEIENPKRGQFVRLNGKRLGAATTSLFWAPQRGPFELQLVQETNQVLDSVQFQVR